MNVTTKADFSKSQKTLARNFIQVLRCKLFIYSDTMLGVKITDVLNSLIALKQNPFKYFLKY